MRVLLRLKRLGCRGKRELVEIPGFRWIPGHKVLRRGSRGSGGAGGRRRWRYLVLGNFLGAGVWQQRKRLGIAVAVRVHLISMFMQ